jgi:hypothetical protein
MSIVEELAARGIHIGPGKGRIYVTCPQCSHLRKGAHKNLKVLGVSVEGDHAHYGCNHCGWTGAVGKPNGHAEAWITYDYADENGELLFQKVRNPPGREPRFYLRHLENGKFVKGRDKTHAGVIYRLPQVRKAIEESRTIVVVEGEKDANRLWLLGIPATCSPDGAAEPGQRAKWRRQHSEHLRGADLIVTGDNDEPGRAHIEATVAASKGIAARIRVLDPKYWHVPVNGKGKPGKDVSDWLDADRAREIDLPELLQQATDVTSKQEAAANAEADAGVSIDDFYAYMPEHTYIFTPTRDMWPASSVNARITPIPITDARGEPVFGEDGKRKHIKATVWLDAHKPVEQMTWVPGAPMLIRNKLIADGGWIDRNGVTCMNLYRPPTIKPGDARKATPWVDHVRKVYPDDAPHIFAWLAHRRQSPHEKINHALVLGGSQGIGKDTLLEPIKQGVGAWNFAEVSPQDILAPWGSFLKSVILRVNEAHDLGEFDRYQLYDRMKAHTAAPPDVLRINEKFRSQYYVPNVTGVIITTNHKTDGIYLPPDDRRHYVAWSDRVKEEFSQDYWSKMWAWYENGGIAHVVAYLESLDLSGFDPKAPPKKTEAFWAIVDAGRSPEDAELADVLDILGNPIAVTLSKLAYTASGEFQVWLNDRKNRRLIPHRMEKCGYVPVRNEAAKDGHWKVGDKRQVIYAKANMPLRDRIAAATRLAGR